jgi:hypothetical protein
MDDLPIPALQRNTTRGNAVTVANTSPANFSWAGDKLMLINFRSKMHKETLRRGFGAWFQMRISSNLEMRMGGEKQALSTRFTTYPVNQRAASFRQWCVRKNS